MPAAGSRLLLDVPLASIIGAAIWFGAQWSRWFEGAGGRRDGPPGRSGPWAGTGGGPGESFEIWWLPLPFVVIMMGGLVIRRAYPRVAFLLVVAGVTGFLAIGGPYGPVLLAPALAVYSPCPRPCRSSGGRRWPHS